MYRPMNSVCNILCLLFCGFFFVVGFPNNADAALPTMSSRVIADSAEPFNRRIYSYDMQIDSQGNVHIVYSKPYSARKAYVYYVRRVDGTWQSQTLLSSDGYQDNKSTFLVIGNDNRIHVCYIKDEGASEGLYYRTINNGSATAEVFVDDGGWWSRMQLDGNGYPVFLRGSKDWADPGKPSKLALLTTTDGANWGRSLLALHDVTQFRIADFLYANGTYHITYGDSEYLKDVWNGKAMTERISGTFHNLYYATSQDGLIWTEHLVDSSGTLYDLEFWTSMVLVGGNPLIAMYKYAEYGNQYSRGTSAILYEWTGSNFDGGKIITNQVYPDTNEGMGVGLAVNGNGDYFGAWDFSPNYPQILPGSPRGNTAMRRSGPKNDWNPVAQLDPFSLEGRTRLRIHAGKLFFLALGDFTDAKLYFHEYNIAVLNTILPPPGGVPSANAGMVLPAVYHMLLP